MSDMALIPYADYQAACDKVRETLGGTDKIKSGDLAGKIGEAVAAGGGGGGVELPALSDPATAADIGAGKDVIGADGQRMVGTAPYRTATNLSVSGNKVTVPAGLYKNSASKAVAAGTLGLPGITVDKSTGMITAYSQVTVAGYLPATSRSNMVLQATQGAKTVVPSSEEQTAVAAGTYVTGDVKVAAVEEGAFAVTGVEINENTGMVSVSAKVTKSGYLSEGASVAAGSQLPTQGAKTVVPSAEEQIAAKAGTYLLGDIKVAAVSDGGGGELETCEVYIYNMQDYSFSAYTSVEGDTVAANTVAGYLDAYFTCPKNSIITICAPYYQGYNANGAVEMYDEWYDGGLLVFWVAGDGGIDLY